jgi:hypothetical protein
MTPTAQRILLVPSGRPRLEQSGDPKLRRYRLARLRLASTRQPTDRRHAHLARAYD